MNTKNSTKNRLAGIGVALVAAALPLSLAAPAQASTTKDGCTVTPQTPEYRQTSNPNNIPYVFYPFEITCDASPGGVSVELSIQTWEQDLAGRSGDVDANGVNNADEDRIGSAHVTRSFGAAGGTKNVDVRGLLPHTDTDFDEEVYDKEKFRVTSGQVTGGWSAFEFSPVLDLGW